MRTATLVACVVTVLAVLLYSAPNKSTSQLDPGSFNILLPLNLCLNAYTHYIAGTWVCALRALVYLDSSVNSI